MSSIKNRLPKDGGFTIIEVVLVLAIAGLIFLIVFLALPQLQRSRRDTQRRSDAGRVLSSLESFSSNTQGQYPASNPQRTTFTEQYLFVGLTPPSSDAISDPQTGEYNVSWSAAPTEVPVGDVYIEAQSRCDGATANTRDISVTIGLEEGTYCQDNL